MGFNIDRLSALSNVLRTGNTTGAFDIVVSTGRAITGQTNLTLDATALVEVGTATATGITLGRAGVLVTIPGNLLVSGTTTTVSTTNLVVTDALIYGNSGGVADSPAGIAWDQGIEDDAIVLFNGVAGRFEVGRVDTTGGTVVPASLSVFSNLKVSNLLLAGTAVTADAGLTITATAATLGLVATGANTITATVNGNTRLTVADAAITSTIHLLFSADNTHDIGAAGATRPRTVYARTSFVAAGAANSLTIGDGSLSQSAGGLTVTSTGAALTLVATGANLVQVTTNGSARWNVSSAGHLLANTDNTIDIGAAGATRPANVHVGTSVVVAANITIATGSVASAGALLLTAGGADALTFNTNANARWNVSANGHFLANTDNSLDIGATGATRPRTIFVRTSVVAQGAANGLTMADGSINQSAGGLTVTSTGAALALVATGANTITAAVNGNTRLTIADASITATIHLLFSADNAHDIGATGATRPRSIYVRTSLIAQGGTNALTVADGAVTQSAGGLTITSTGAALVLATTGANNDVNATTGAGGRLTANALPVPVVLSVTSVNLAAVATTALYTVPAGKSAVILDSIVKPTTATAAVGDAALGIGVAAGEDDIFASQTLTGLNTTTERFAMARLPNARVAAATEVITAGVDAADTGTALVADVYLIGYLI